MIVEQKRVFNAETAEICNGLNRVTLLESQNIFSDMNMDMNNIKRKNIQKYWYNHSQNIYIKCYRCKVTGDISRN